MLVAVSTSLHALEATNAEEMEENAEDVLEIGLLASVRMRFRQDRAMNFLRLARRWKAAARECIESPSRRAQDLISPSSVPPDEPS